MLLFYASQVYIPSNAPFTPAPSWTLHNRCSLRAKISPFLPKQKFATPPPIKIRPKRTPPGDQIFIPSPQPL